MNDHRPAIRRAEARYSSSEWLVGVRHAMGWVGFGERM
jgi:hypothetical protein